MFDAHVRQISKHVYGMKAGKPDRPSLCAVVGTRHSLMLDAGASDAHTRLFLDGLKAHGVRMPEWVVLTHWHWDHVFGAAETGLPVIAHALTAEGLAVMGRQLWDDGALDARVASGEEIAFCADNIKLELPEPRHVRIAQPGIVFTDSLDFDLGGVQVHVRHVGGDHAADACVAYVEEDGLLFLSDCLYDDIYAEKRTFTREKALPLIETILDFKADIIIEGHNPEPVGRDAFVRQMELMRRAAEISAQFRGDEAAIQAAFPEMQGNEDWTWYVESFCAGYPR